MSRVQQAIEGFRNPYKCAQAIYAVYSAEVNDRTLEQMEGFSGGRAPGNMCGALFAVMMLAPEEKRGQIISEFVSITGSTKCMDIREGPLCGMTCEEYVGLAAGILEKVLPDENAKSENSKNENPSDG